MAGGSLVGLAVGMGVGVGVDMAWHGRHSTGKGKGKEGEGKGDRSSIVHTPLLLVHTYNNTGDHFYLNFYLHLSSIYPFPC